MASGSCGAVDVEGADVADKCHDAVMSVPAGRFNTAGASGIAQKPTLDAFESSTSARHALRLVGHDINSAIYVPFRPKHVGLSSQFICGVVLEPFRSGDDIPPICTLLHHLRSWLAIASTLRMIHSLNGRATRPTDVVSSGEF